MKELGIQGVTRRRFKTGTTKRDAKARPAPDLVNRDFSAKGPDQLWVADITYVPTWTGWLYLAVVLDAWSRRIVGWAMAPHMKAELVGAALEMAVRRRQPRGGITPTRAVTSLAFGEHCREAGISRWARWAAYDNAMCESFFATLESNSSTGGVFRRWPRRGVKSSNSSRASTTPAGSTPRSATSRRRTSRNSTMRPEANLQRRGRPKLSGLLRPARFVGVARYPSPPLKEREKETIIRHHQPQTLTVRESGVGPVRLSNGALGGGRVASFAGTTGRAHSCGGRGARERVLENMNT